MLLAVTTSASSPSLSPSARTLTPEAATRRVSLVRQVLKSLSTDQLQRLADVLTEVKVKPGEFVIKQGEEGDTFYIISDGKAEVTKNDPKAGPKGKVVGEITQGQYFGERALLNKEPRAANVVAAGTGQLKLLSISKDSFEEVLGPLADIIQDVRAPAACACASRSLHIIARIAQPT